MVRVSTGARLHVGFQNLSLARKRLYGGIGVAVQHPCVVIEAEQAETVDAEPPVKAETERVVSMLDLPGARVRVLEGLPRHVGLGSGTQHALAVLTAVAAAYDRSVSVRKLAPELGRGGRSGVGVGAFESGGFIVDGGHPTERFTTAPPAPGEWTVPPIIAHHRVPEQWRFLVVVPSGRTGVHGDSEDEQMRSIVERADPQVSDELATVLTQQLLPAVANGDHEAFGRAANTFCRLNGAWYADEQGGIYRPPAGRIAEQLSESSALSGIGQSSWGPAVYGITDSDHVDAARAAGERALSEIDTDGDVIVSSPRNRGASVE